MWNYYIFSICFTTKHLNSSEYKIVFDFNYLNNNKVVANTETLLLNNKISKENINLWLEHVKKYNLKNKNFIQNTYNGWSTIRLSNYNKIDFTETLNGWTEEEDSVDLNCRISTFILIKDIISSEYFTKKYDSDIEKEINKMDAIWGDKITNKDAITFRSLFTPIELNIDNSKNIDVYDETLKSLKNHWKKENLIFENNNPSLIQAVYIEPNNNNMTATIGHVGMLIENSNVLYFIGKKILVFLTRFQNFKIIMN